jgi:acyl-CoA synthetase (NDP forming)
VFDAACRRLGIIRVSSPEDLIATADVLARLGRIQGGFALAAMSGGMCEIGADRAAAAGLPLPPLSPETITGLRAVMPAFGTPNNPLDFTGAAMLKPELVEFMLKALVADPALGAVACVFDAPETEDRTGFILRVFQAIKRGFADANKPTMVLSNISVAITKAGRELTQQVGVHFFGVGVDRGVAAIARARQWWIRRSQLTNYGEPAFDSARRDANSPQPSSERQVLDYLSGHGVPVIPAKIATSPEQATQLAMALNGALALKIVSAQILHKSEVGGVALNVTPDAAAEAYRTMLSEVRSARPDAAIDGVVVSPMRSGGVELFVGILRDPTWGAVIAVGLGGVFVEALKDTALRLLPVSVDEVLEMFDELHGRALLDGFRGAPAVDRRAAAKAIVQIGNAALDLGPTLVLLEVNPLLATNTGAEALDGLAVWNEEKHHAA